jgi:hypothetical protein
LIESRSHPNYFINMTSANTDAQCRPSVAAGADVRIQSESLTWFALDFGNDVRPLAVLAVTGADQ